LSEISINPVLFTCEVIAMATFRERYSSSLRCFINSHYHSDRSNSIKC